MANRSGLHVATAPKTVEGHGQVEDQAPAAGCVLEVAADLNVAAPLACACRYAVLRADRVSGRAEQRPKRSYHPIMRLWLASKRKKKKSGSKRKKKKNLCGYCLAPRPPVHSAGRQDGGVSLISSPQCLLVSRAGALCKSHTSLPFAPSLPRAQVREEGRLVVPLVWSNWIEDRRVAGQQAAATRTRNLWYPNQRSC